MSCYRALWLLKRGPHGPSAILQIAKLLRPAEIDELGRSQKAPVFVIPVKTGIQENQSHLLEFSAAIPTKKPPNLAAGRFNVRARAGFYVPGLFSIPAKWIHTRFGHDLFAFPRQHIVYKLL